MPSRSLRAALESAGHTGQVSLPHGLCSWTFPPRLSTLEKALTPVRPETWDKPKESHHTDQAWTEECQGVTTDGTYWYLTSNNNTQIDGLNVDHDNLRAVRAWPRGGLIGGEASATYWFGGDSRTSDIAHVGDLDWHDGLLYVACEDPVCVVLLRPEPGAFTYVGRHTLQQSSSAGPDQQLTHNPWCAVNPWDGLLYSSNFGDFDAVSETDPDYLARHLFGYDRATWTCRRQIPIDPPRQKVQGGAFAPNGQLLLSSSADNAILCFDGLTGRYLGSSPIMSEGTQEVEGLCYAPTVHDDGTVTNVHVILLDNSLFEYDGMYFKHYRAPDLMTQ